MTYSSTNVKYFDIFTNFLFDFYNFYDDYLLKKCVYIVSVSLKDKIVFVLF